MISGEPEDWTPDECEALAQTLLGEVSKRLNPFNPHESVGLLLLASIAASTLAIAKKTKLRK